MLPSALLVVLLAVSAVPSAVAVEDDGADGPPVPFHLALLSLQEFVLKKKAK